MDKMKIWKTLPAQIQLSILESANKEFKTDYKVAGFWKRLFGNMNQSEEDLNVIFSLKSLTLDGCEKLLNLNFIRCFENVKELHLWGKGVADIAPLEDLPMLTKLYAWTSIKSYSPLKESKITLLYNNCSSAKDFHYLSNIGTMKKLELCDNPQLKSVDFF